MNLLGVVYRVERDPKLLNGINRELLAVSDFPDWNPPVYLDVAGNGFPAPRLELDQVVVDMRFRLRHEKHIAKDAAVVPPIEIHRGYPIHPATVVHEPV